MARSQDELVDVLVAEIAASGSQGCNPTQILSLIDPFYAPNANGNGRTNENTEETRLNSVPTIDTNLRYQIWTSLTLRSNVSVGRNRSFNSLALSDLEALSAVQPERVRVFAHRSTASSQATLDGAAALLVQETPGVIPDTGLEAEISLRTDGKLPHEVTADTLENDDFGFPRRSQPTLQFRNGRVSLEDGLEAANPDDFKPSAGDLVAVEKGNREHVIEEHNPSASQENDDYCGACGDTGELICCDGCPNAFHGPCLQPPLDITDLPDDRWYCPHCEMNSVLNDNTRNSLRSKFAISAVTTSSMPKATDTPRRTSANVKVRTKPLGRPRKFLLGTEQFWRTQFPKAPALFASRPPNFDATLLRALHNGLPTPMNPTDVSQNWIDNTLTVLERSVCGLYVSHKGNVQRGSGTRKAAGQILIFRSTRLREVDLSEGFRFPLVRFLSSSAAHTFTPLRYYPQAKTSAQSTRSASADSAETGTATTPEIPARGKGPKLGIFYDDRHQCRVVQSSSFLPAASTLRRHSEDSVSTVGPPAGVDDVEPKFPNVNPWLDFASSSDMVTSQGDSPVKVAGGSVVRGFANRLPPPLTTRAASKRQESARDGIAAADGGALPGIATSTRPRGKSPAPRVSLHTENLSRKRQLSVVDGALARPTKRGKGKSTASSSTSMRQQIILDLIERSGGAIPDSPLLLRNAVTAAWHKSGQTGVPDKRTVDASLKALYTAGKVKKTTFSFKDQRNLMVISSVLAKPDIRPLDAAMRQLQQNIINVYPNHYTPPGMYADQPNQLGRIPATQIGIQLHTKQRQSTTQDEKRQSSSALQWIENEASGLGKSVGRVLHTKAVSRIERLEGSIRPRKWPVFDEASTPRSFSQTFATGQNEDVSFLMRQEQPIVFDARAPSSPSDLTGKHSEKGKRKVVWQKGSRIHPMPQSLEEILHDGRRREEANHRLSSPDLDLKQFESEVDSVARWEQRSFNRFQERSDAQSWSFISHFVNQSFEALRMEHIPVQFNGLTWYDKSEQERLYLPGALKRLWASCSDPQTPSVAGSSVIAEQADASKTQTQIMNLSEMSPGASKPQRGPYKKRKRKLAKTRPSKKRKVKNKSRKSGGTEVEPAYLTKPDGTVVDVSGYINAPVKRARGTQHLRNMSEAAIYRLTIAVVVVRTLGGGIDKHVDWNIVMRVFPAEDLDFIHNRWRTIRTKFRRDIAALTENLQQSFCSAYVQGEVPELDFDDLYNNDWEGIVDWAVRNLDKSSVKEIDDLPDTRGELADTKLMGFEEQRGMREYLGYNVGSSLPAREAAQASTVFAKPVGSLALQPPAFSSDVHEKEDEQLRIAKSWALATVLTPHERYDAHAAKVKLSKLAHTSRASEALFDRAEKSLKGQKTIFLDQEAPSKILGRGHKPSKLFYDAIDARRTVQAKVLRQAVRYKRDILDPLFSAGEQITFQHTSAQDGDMVAILNLLANGRIRLQIGPDVPKNRYGLLTAEGTGTYQTRHLGKDRLSFTVLVEAVDGKYVYGNPLEMRLAPVPTIAERDTTAIPLWVNIHGNFQDELWELVICAVIGLISTRPGINAKELVKTLSPSLTLWETEIVLGWLERSGFAQTSVAGEAQGWNTTEWWWLVCGGRGGW